MSIQKTQKIGNLLPTTGGNSEQGHHNRFLHGQTTDDRRQLTDDRNSCPTRLQTNLLHRHILLFTVVSAGVAAERGYGFAMDGGCARVSDRDAPIMTKACDKRHARSRPDQN